MANPETREEVIARRGYEPGIKGDQFGLGISNYEVTAKYLAERLKGKGKTALELCCGLGVTLKELAKVFDSVAGVELDKERVGYCAANLGDLKNVTLIQGNVSDVSLLKTLRADVVVYDVPYWDTKYLPEAGLLRKNPDTLLLLNTVIQYVSRNIVVFAPPGTCTSWTSSLNGIMARREVQRVVINDFYDRDHVYFGNLVENAGETEIRLFGGKTTQT